MKKRNKVFIIAFVIQFIIVLSIVLFPEKLKIEKFTNYRTLIKPTDFVEYPIVPPNEIRKKIAEVNLFSKFNGTRGTSASHRSNAIVIVSNSKYEEFIHFDRLMVEAYSRNIGSVFIDPRDAPLYVSIIKEDGSYYTSKERQEIFFSEIIEYMKDIGYQSFSLWIFGDWFEPVVKSIKQKNEIDSVVIVSNQNFYKTPKDFPPAITIIGDKSDGFEKNRLFYNNLLENNNKAELIVLNNTYNQLKDSSGKLAKETEKRIFDSALLWAEEHFEN